MKETQTKHILFTCRLGTNVSKYIRGKQITVCTTQFRCLSMVFQVEHRKTKKWNPWFRFDINWVTRGCLTGLKETRIHTLDLFTTSSTTKTTIASIVSITCPSAQPHFQHHHHRCLHTKWLALTPVLPKIYCKKCFFAQKMTYKLQEGEYVKKKHCRHKPNFTPKIEWSLQLKAHMVRSVISLFWLSRKLSSRSWVRISVESSWWR